MFEDKSESDAKSFHDSVEEFLESAASWLSEEDSPAVVTLKKLAHALDEKIHPPLLQQFGLTYRALLKKRPGANQEEGDELDDILPN